MLQNYNRYRLLMEFFNRPSHRFHLRELSRDLNLGLPSIINHVSALKDEELILKEKTHPFSVYVANRDSSKFKLLKKNDMLWKLHNCKLITYLNTRLSFPTAIVLFGSGAYGEDTEESDLDIAIISPPGNLTLTSFEQAIHRKIQTHFFDSIEDMKKSPELFNNIVNGTVLEGFLKVI